MRDYKNIDEYINLLYSDIYPQPPDEGHTGWATESIDAFVKNSDNFNTVLDLGCGQGFCQEIFNRWGKDYTGIAIGEDVVEAQKIGKNVVECDFSFLPHPDESWDFLYARHSLEHSPMPLLTLMEWHRVSKHYLGIVVPAVEYWRYGGRNHYFVLNQEQWKNLFDVAGFTLKYESIKRHFMPDANREIEIEYWFLLERK